MSVPKFETFTQFWPYYLQEHSLASTRAWHFVGTTISIGWAIAGLVQLSPLYLLPAIVSGYAFAWVSHFFIEKNRPATFTYPRWSFIADFRMWCLMLTGRINAELKKHNVVPKNVTAPAAQVG